LQSLRALGMRSPGHVLGKKRIVNEGQGVIVHGVVAKAERVIRSAVVARFV
jgi:hypothetical protein